MSLYTSVSQQIYYQSWNKSILVMFAGKQICVRSPTISTVSNTYAICNWICFFSEIWLACQLPHTISNKQFSFSSQSQFQFHFINFQLSEVRSSSTLVFCNQVHSLQRFYHCLHLDTPHFENKQPLQWLKQTKTTNYGTKASDPFFVDWMIEYWLIWQADYLMNVLIYLLFLILGLCYV